MLKFYITSAVTTLLISSSLQAHPIAPGEVKQFAAQVLHVDLDKSPDDVAKRITADYEQSVKLTEILLWRMKTDPEFIRVSENLALDMWSKRISAGIKPTDDELKKVFNAAKDLKVAPSYKLRHIVVLQESFADDLIKQIKDENENERNKLFTSLAAVHSQDQMTKEKGGSVGWVDASALSPITMNALKDKGVGTLIKVAAGNNVWDIILVDEVKQEHPATFDEAKNFLINSLRKQAIEAEAKRILEANHLLPKPVIKSLIAPK
jgi:parvulin-like peptidyl-prolyl isomerase